MARRPLFPDGIGAAEQTSAVTRWAILTGEYQPQAGGVADYTRLIARGLADAGDIVKVYAPPMAEKTPADPGVCVRRLPDHFGPRGLLRLDAELSARPPDRILIQYVPHAYGYKAMNLPFIAWVARRARQIAPVWVMFHEVTYPIVKGQPLRHAILGRVTAHMARQLAAAAQRVFVSIPAWDGLLKSVGYHGRPPEWLPVPSTIPVTVDPAAVGEVRRRIASEINAVILGHFGTFGRLIVPLLDDMLPALLKRDEKRIGLLVGRGGEKFAERLRREHLLSPSRLIATGAVAPAEVAAHLAACDVLVQPYPDGASSRRTSLMAGLALGVPMMTTEGPLSESLWRQSGAVALAPCGDPAAGIEAVERLLTDPVGRAKLGEQARLLYQERFDVRHVVNTLRGGKQG